jgi:phosphoglycolate phosphatase
VPEYNNLLFDLDGTLSDPRQGIVNSILYALQRLEQPLPLAGTLERYIGPPLRDAFAELLQTDDYERIERAVALYRERFAGEGLYENTLYPGIGAVLNELQAHGATLFVATSKPVVYAEKIIDHFNLSGFFRRIYGSELDGTRSAKSELIEYILAEESLTPAAALMIGDRKHDVIGAAKNAVPAIGVLWGFGSREELLQAGLGPSHLCVNPQMLRDRLIG